MRSVPKTWPAQLVATITTLALVVACTVGTYSHYGHAASHHHGNAEHSHYHGGGTVHSHHPGPHVEHSHRHGPHSGSTHEQAAVGVGPGHPSAEHAVPDTGNALDDCSDPICHGGHAILVVAQIISHPLGSALVIPPAATLSDAQPGRLDRPPKSSVDA